MLRIRRNSLIRDARRIEPDCGARNERITRALEPGRMIAMSHRRAIGVLDVDQSRDCPERRLAPGAGKRRDPSAILEKCCLTRLDPKAFNRLLGQRSDDPVNIAAISAGRFQSQTGCVGQDNPKGSPVSNPLPGGCHHECLCHSITIPLSATGSSSGCPGSSP
jgi:hypothetical protein